VLGVTRLPHVIRYLEAMERRLDKLPESVDKDRAKMVRVQTIERECAAAPLAARSRTLWLTEELRVSVFAQALGTAEPVSEERIRRELRR
jgi:ATP-dependent helicase HrpA